jgi:hypothetical protein
MPHYTAQARSGNKPTVEPKKRRWKKFHLRTKPNPATKLAVQAKERQRELSGTRSNPGEVKEKIPEPLT